MNYLRYKDESLLHKCMYSCMYSISQEQHITQGKHCSTPLMEAMRAFPSDVKVSVKGETSVLSLVEALIITIVYPYLTGLKVDGSGRKGRVAVDVKVFVYS